MFPKLVLFKISLIEEDLPPIIINHIKIYQKDYVIPKYPLQIYKDCLTRFLNNFHISKFVRQKIENDVGDLKPYYKTQDIDPKWKEQAMIVGRYHEKEREVLKSLHDADDQAPKFVEL